MKQDRENFKIKVTLYTLAQAFFCTYTILEALSRRAIS